MAMPETVDTLLQAAAELARLTGTTALAHFRRTLEVERKPDGSPVTEADRSAERAAREWLARRFPHDTILGEEFGRSAGTSGRTWLLDPVDGTRTFVRGVPLWGSLVAVVEGDTVLAGAADFPAVGERLAAAPGEGCWHNGARCRVSDVATLAAATVLSTDEHAFAEPERQSAWERLAGGAETVRTWGDCYGYLLVATGRAEVMVDARLNAWDGACFLPILEEAGGVLSNLDGKRTWDLTSAVASNAALAAEVRGLLSGNPPTGRAR
jgi:histidinol phosphatase-like enzyme (inositol monophosphatase family)